jgi:hypothetical protein
MEGMAIAIVAFSLGVELGHQIVVLPVVAGLKLARSICTDESSRNRLSLAMMCVGSLLIAVAGMAYLLAALK